MPHDGFMMTNNEAMEALKSARKGISAAFAHCGRFADEDTCNDLAQESIVKVLTTYDPAKATETGIPGFAYRLSYHQAMDYLRGKSKVRKSDNERVIAPRKRKGEDRHETSDDQIHVETETPFVRDDSGSVVDMEIPDHSGNPLDLLLAMERESALNQAIDNIDSEAQRNALKATLADDSDARVDLATRQNKMRAVNAIVDNLPASLRGGKRSANKGKKRAK